MNQISNTAGVNLEKFMFSIFLTLAIMSYLTNYGQKKSINNIQDLGLSAASRQSIGWQPIPVVYFKRKVYF
jgi:hypothetical protein